MVIRFLVFVSVFFSFILTGQSQETGNEKVVYDTWKTLLKENVTDSGFVDYDGFKKEAVPFANFLNQLSSTKIDNTWSKADKMAFWINVYNAYTIKLIVNNYPIDSIKKINDPWGIEFFTINGDKMSLGEVEHQILRKYGDPRIHFAINCASISCPRLLNKPYTAKNLEFLLENQTKEFINNPTHNTITESRVNVSKIFDWFKKDFKANSGKVTSYINKYSKVLIEKQKEKGYKAYNWSVNAVK